MAAVGPVQAEVWGEALAEAVAVAVLAGLVEGVQGVEALAAVGKVC